MEEDYSSTSVQKSSLGYFKKLKMALFSSGNLFDNVKTDGLGSGLKFLLITTVLTGIIIAILLMAFTSFIGGLLSLLLPALGGLLPVAGLIMAPILILALLITVVIASFVGAIIQHIFVKLFGGKGSYAETYKAIAYASAPMLFSWIPVVGLIGILWQVVILTIGISKLHNISKGRAFLTWLIPIVVIGATIFLLLPEVLIPTGSTDTDIAKKVTGECFEQSKDWWCYATIVGNSCIEGPKDNCEFYRTLELKDIKLCERIQESKIKSRCIGANAGYLLQKELCITAPNPDECYFYYVFGNVKDPTVCELIKDAELKKNCEFFAR